MFRKPHAISRQLILATALALGASGVARADDSSMNPFIGDSYRYFNGGHNLGDPGQSNRPVLSVAPADPTWRQSHPHGLSERDLQAMSSSGLSAAAEQLDGAAVATALADKSPRASHPNLGEREMQALSSSTLARWQVGNGTESTTAASAASEQATLAQNPGKETLSARVARYFRPENADQAGNN